jgi:hypothetical protein
MFPRCGLIASNGDCDVTLSRQFDDESSDMAKIGDPIDPVLPEEALAIDDNSRYAGALQPLELSQRVAHLAGRAGFGLFRRQTPGFERGAFRCPLDRRRLVDVEPLDPSLEHGLVEEIAFARIRRVESAGRQFFTVERQDRPALRPLMGLRRHGVLPAREGSGARASRAGSLAEVRSACGRIRTTRPRPFSAGGHTDVVYHAIAILASYSPEHRRPSAGARFAIEGVADA